MSILKTLFSGPQVTEPKPGPTAATRADASFVSGGIPDNIGGFNSLVSTGSQGLKRKAKTAKTSLVGGA